MDDASHAIGPSVAAGAGGDRIGRTVGPYRIEGRLGAGGMGVVYRAFDTRLDRPVALKFLPHALALEAESRRRLLVEARAAARLDHPNIGTIYAVEGLDDGDADGAGEPFLVLALYEGVTLAERLRAGPLPVPEALELALQCARGLERAHRNGIVHRDVKPANLLLTADGLVKILDFGLARHDAFDGLTRPGAVVGTPGYLAPEQVRGQPADARTDLWALGVVLYEALTGVSPFATEGGLAAAILRVLQHEPESVRRLRPDVPDALEAVVERALAKEPDARYGSAGELAEDLERARSGVPPAAPPAFPAAAPSVRGAPVPAPADGALPEPAAPLVGRLDELAIARLHLADPHARLLTLFGPGGAGKTRLALEIAREQERLGGFPDGVRFVPLDALDDPGRLPDHLAGALGLDLHGQDDPLAVIVRRLGGARALLVLDNFEQLVSAAEGLATLLQGCPRLALLVTSRERLGLAEEWVLPVTGLATPPEVRAPAEEALRYEAVQLFVERARRADLRFAPSDDDLHHIGHIGRLVQGSPLGLELAAAWTRSASCEEIAREIRDNLDFLESPARAVRGRHRSVRATFEVSWALLAPPERDRLAALSVFAGGFDAAAARAVADAGRRELAALADKSLLQGGEGGRFGFHPLVHQYAREKLAATPEVRERVRERHGLHFLRTLEGQEKALRGPDASRVQELLVADLDNFRTAWAWAIEARRATEIMASAKPLDAFLDDRGMHREAAQLFEEAVAGLREDDPAERRARGDALASLAWASYRLGRFAEAGRTAERAVALLRDGPAGVGLLTALNTLAAVEFGMGAFADAKRHWGEMLTLEAVREDRRRLAVTLSNLASAEQELEEFEASRAHLQESLALCRELGDVGGVVSALHNLATQEFDTGDFEASLRYEEEALRHAREAGFDLYLPYLLHGMGASHFERGELAEAERAYREALEYAERSGNVKSQATIRAGLASLRTETGDVDAAEAEFLACLRSSGALPDPPTALRCLAGLAEVRAKQGRVAQAVAWLELVLAHPARGRSLTRLAASVLEAWQGELAPQALADARAAGRALRLEEAVGEALRGRRDR